MNIKSNLSRRLFLKQSCATGVGLASLTGLPLATGWLRASEESNKEPDWVRRIADPEIRAGVRAAVFKNLIPAATEHVYPGHFTINADGGSYGSDSTWPGLDSWQMVGPYLQLGRTRMILDYFDFVRASQRKDGNIPFAIFNGNTRPGGCLRGLRYYWRERYHLKPDGSISPDGSQKYCEYAAVLGAGRVEQSRSLLGLTQDKDPHRGRHRATSSMSVILT